MAKDETRGVSEQPVQAPAGATNGDQVPAPSPPGPQTTPTHSVVAAIRKALAYVRAEHTGAVSQAGNSRELVETVVFVAVLVLLLKTFVAEAFVIPTGSMATTLWGYQKVVTCPKCGEQFPVNCSEEVEGEPPIRVTGCTCPNCRYPINFEDGGYDPPSSSGDRVLVDKCLYDTSLGKPHRLDVGVFKFPREPQKKQVATNYIKRIIGLPGETIGIYYGKVYVLPPDKSAKYDDSEARPEERWREEFMHAQTNLDSLPPGFEIIRKPPGKMLAMRRLVYDNDHPATDLEGVLPPRWVGAEGTGWSADDQHGFRHEGAPDALGWLRYRHLLRPADPNAAPDPELITDFMGYNTRRSGHRGPQVLPQNWTGDLMLECEVTVDQAGGELVLELSKGVDHFQARWSQDEWSLVRLIGEKGQGEPKTQPLDARPLKMKPGTHRIRFADFDERLTLWVDGSLPFGDGTAYDAPAQRGPTRNDLEPASIGVRGGGIGIHHLKLWRDTYYTLEPGRADSQRIQSLVPDRPESDAQQQEQLLQLHALLSDPTVWDGRDGLRELSAKTLYVQPGHYLCLGDNSEESSDSRAWGLVPERLLLGRALLVYYPFYFPWWPFDCPVNRVGAIR